MVIFELVLLSITYTALAIALFLQILCFSRKMENIETIAFTVSLLLLVVSISLSPIFENENTTISTLICMVLISSTTFINTLSERKHSINPINKKIHVALAFCLTLLVIIGYQMDYLHVIQYAVVAFLIFSVIISMLIVRATKPVKKYVHLEKSGRFFGILFFILVPLYLAFHYGLEKTYDQFPFGFLLYIAFIMLALTKIFDDLQRLSLINRTIEPQKQHFKNYGLTEREEEIAILLSKGLTYKKISEQLFISIPTVKSHASNIYRKCKVKSRNELTHLLSI